MKYSLLLVLAVISFLSIQLFAGSTENAVEKLKAAKLDVNYDHLSLEDVFNDIQERTGVAVTIDRKSAAEVDLDDIEITMKLYDVSAYDLLMTIARQSEMRILFKYGMVWLVTPEHYYDGRNVVKIYDVRDIVMPIRDFPGIKIRLEGNSTGNTVKWEPEDDFKIERIGDVSDLEEIIPEFAAAKSWDENPGASIQQLGGMLIIRQSPEAHVEIMKFLSMIRSNG